MAIKEDPIFVCLPTGNKNLEYFEVDPRRLTSAHLSTIYMKGMPSAGGRNKGSGFMVSHGHAHLVEAKPDITDLLSILDEHQGNTLDALAHSDASFKNETREVFEKLRVLLTLVNDDDQENAGYAMSELGHLLMSITSSAAEFHRRGAEAREQANSTFAVVSKVHEVSDEIETFTLEHGQDAEDLVKAYDALNEPLQKLCKRPNELRARFQELQAVYADSAEPWASIQTFFSEGEDCFFIRAFDYEHGQGSDDMRSDLARARQYLVTANDTLQALESRKQPVSQCINDTLKLINRIGPLITKYREANNRFRRHLDLVGARSVDQGVVTVTVYERAAKLHERRAADIDTMEKDYRIAEQGCRPFMNTEVLTLSPRLRSCLNEVRRILEALNERPSLAPAQLHSTPSN